MKVPEIDHVEEIARRVEEVAQWLSSLNSDPYMREAIMRIAVREFGWAMNEHFKMPYEIADQMGTMGEVLQQETTKAK